MNIATWAREYLGKQLSLNTVHRCIQKCKLKPDYARRKPYINWVQKHCQVLWAPAPLRWTERQRTRVQWSAESTFQLPFRKNGCCLLHARDKENLPGCDRQKGAKFSISDDMKGMRVSCWRERGCDSGRGAHEHFGEECVSIKVALFPLDDCGYSRRKMSDLILHDLEQSVFTEAECVCAALACMWCRSVFHWERMVHRREKNQTMKTTDCRSKVKI